MSGSTYNRDHTGPAEGFVRVVIEYAPHAWHEVLGRVNTSVAEKNLMECIRGNSERGRTAAAIIESAMIRDDDVGDMARLLRKRFPSASMPSTNRPQFHGKQNRRRSKH